MKVEIPENLKADLPTSVWGKVLTATPVVMTVLATMLAGLSSSEMTRAQYARSHAAQLQSKAGDQWGFFQAKRLRGALQENSLDLLKNSTEVLPFDSHVLIEAVGARAALMTNAEVRASADWLKTDAGEQILALLEKGKLPTSAAAPPLDPALQRARDAIEEGSETRIAERVGALTEQQLTKALAAARQASEALDAATKPVIKGLDCLEVLQPQLPSTIARSLFAARLRFSALRYEAEARLNQNIANIYEVQVRKSNLEAERHHARSQRFFFGMLAAQAAVIIATFAIAARQRNLLWSLAAGVGLVAVLLAIYVYLFV
jgi:hypothetical protein